MTDWPSERYPTLLFPRVYQSSVRVYHCQSRLCVRESSRATHSWWADAGSQSQLLGKSETADGHLFPVLPWGSNRGQERRRVGNRRRGIILTPVLWNINVCRKGYRLMHLCACALMTCWKFSRNKHHCRDSFVNCTHRKFPYWIKRSQKSKVKTN